MNKKNLLKITLLSLCLIISIALVAGPTYAQGYCNGTDEVEIADDSFIEYKMTCEGDRVWVLNLLGYTGDIGEVLLMYEVYSINVDGDVEFIGEYTYTESNILAKQENKLETLDGDKVEIEFKFK